MTAPEHAVNPAYPESDLADKLIGCAQVHRVLANGFREVVYRRALAIEMASRGRRFAREQEIKIPFPSWPSCNLTNHSADSAGRC